MEKGKNPYATPFYYKENPLQSGWISKENSGGRVINIDNNPNFRAFWLGGTKLMMNAIFFGKIIDAASGRTEE